METIAPGFKVERYIQNTRYYRHLLSKLNDRDLNNVATERNTTANVERPHTADFSAFLTPGCAYTDSVDEMGILMQAVSDNHTFKYLKETLGKGSKDFKNYRAFVISEYSVRSRNEIGRNMHLNIYRDSAFLLFYG